MSNATKWLTAERLREEQDATITDLRGALKRSQVAYFRAKSKVEDLVAATIQASKDATLAMGPILPIKAPKADPRKRPEVALWHIGDFQGGKRTTSYNSEIMRERLMKFVRKAEKITIIQRADHPVRHCVVAIGGDAIEGMFNFSTQPLEVDKTLFGQFVYVSRLLVDVVREALRIYETVTVVSEWGNHGRLGSRRDCVPRADNADRMVYEMSRQLLAGESRLVWEDSPEDIQRLVIGNYRALVIHGDEIGRNGFASKTSIVQHVTKWKSGSYRVAGSPWSFRDVYCSHYHVHEEYSLPNGEGAVFFTGSTESDNNYASINLASAATPSQRLHFIDPTEGRVTSQFKIWLD